MARLSMIFDVAFKMSAMTRYSQTHLIKSESVLEHTGFVCLLAYYVGRNLIDAGEIINIGKLMEKAVAHDVDEIITGDIPRPTKYYNEGVTTALKGIEDENMEKISDTIGLPTLYEAWSESKLGAEGSIVALCDCLAVVYKAWYEVKMFGNKTIVDHANGLPSMLTRIQQDMEMNFGQKMFINDIISEARSLCRDIY